MPEFLKGSRQLNCNFQRGGVGGSKQKKLPWEVWIVSGTTQYTPDEVQSNSALLIIQLIDKIRFPQSRSPIC